ncbi:MAG TPA: NAD-dependent epimerase/dehydratase family protein [Planctomycetota bacterium]|nr:NAD-dependent epimerase/dehydratase family protein [Planctomycetota bacterium]
MRIFLTGGTGYIGSAIAGALTRAGHSVTALTRSPEKERGLLQLGVSPVRGDLADPATYERIAALHDTIVHAAFEDAETDLIALETLIGAARTDDGRHLVYTSGSWVLGDTHGSIAYENTPIRAPARLVSWRGEHEQLVLLAADEGVTPSVVRPGLVYGGKGGLVSGYFSSAAEEGAANYIGSGRNHLSLIYREDLAQLYRLVVERRGWGVFHGVDGVPLIVEEVARAASELAGAAGATKSIPLAQARARMGDLADALCLDQRVGTRRAGELGWKPRFPSFLEGVHAAMAEWAT